MPNMMLPGSDLASRQLVDALIWKVTENGCGENLVIDELDDLAEKLGIALSLARTRRNMLIPVSRIPPEALGLIFANLQLEYRARTPMSREELLWQKHSIVYVSHVCRYWRETALAHPSLWSIIADVKPDLAISSLVRSADALLDVRIFNADAYDTKVVRLKDDVFIGALVSHSGRFQNLHITTQHNSYTSCHPSRLEVFSLPAPSLESLNIQLNIQEGADPVLPRLFDDYTPNLKRIRLRVFTSWPGNTFRGLTHICLTRQSAIGRPTVLQFLDFLEASPHLEELISVFQYTTRSPAEYVQDVELLPDRLIALNCLKNISIGWWHSRAVKELFSHLTINPDAAVHVWGTGILHDEDSISSLYSDYLARRDQVCDATHLRIIQTNPRITDDEQYVYTSNREIQLDASEWKEDHIMRLVEMIPPTYPALRIEELWLGCERPRHWAQHLTVDNWATLFRYLASLTKLVIWKLPTHHVLSALTVLSDDVDNPVCPALSTIHIYGDDSLAPSCLSAFARQRERVGRPLRSLLVANKTIPLSVANELLALGTFIDKVEYLEEGNSGNARFASPPPGWH